MKKNSGILLAALFLITALSGCEVIGDLIEFGVWVGVLLVVAVIALIYWIVRKFKK